MSFDWKYHNFREEFNNIESLFHYTTFDNLKKIITNKTLKFNRHDLLDDLVEGKRVNDENLNYFVSCFAYDVNESIPFWIL